MASVPFHYVDLRAFCYATEDEQRVVRALRRLLPEGFEIDRAESAGHHGDRILVLSARVESTAGVQTVLDSLGELPAPERERVLDELDERVDEDCNLFVSLDKQAAYGGAVRLGEGISVRGKVESYPATHDRAVETVASAGVL